MTDESELRKDVFAWFGGVAYAAQCFEVELCILLLLTHRLKNSRLTLEQMDLIDAKLSKKTLGALLSELKKHLVIHPDFERMLETYLRKRNHLMHQFFFEQGKNLCSRKGCDTMIEELKELHASMNEAHEIAQTMSGNVRKHLGISEAEIQSLVEAHIQAFIDEE